MIAPRLLIVLLATIFIGCTDYRSETWPDISGSIISSKLSVPINHISEIVNSDTELSNVDRRYIIDRANTQVYEYIEYSVVRSGRMRYLCLDQYKFADVMMANGDMTKGRIGSASLSVLRDGDWVHTRGRQYD